MEYSKYVSRKTKKLRVYKTVIRPTTICKKILCIKEIAQEHTKQVGKKSAKNHFRKKENRRRLANEDKSSAKITAEGAMYNRISKRTQTQMTGTRG